MAWNTRHGAGVYLQRTSIVYHAVGSAAREKLHIFLSRAPLLFIVVVAFLGAGDGGGGADGAADVEAEGELQVVDGFVV